MPAGNWRERGIGRTQEAARASVTKISSTTSRVFSVISVYGRNLGTSCFPPSAERIEVVNCVNTNRKGTPMKRHGHKKEEAIRIEAYLLSEKAGHPAGMEDYFWQEAELIVAAVGDKPAAAKRLAVKSKPKAGKVSKAKADGAGKKTKKKKD
jgi:hypothetical protein